MTPNRSTHARGGSRAAYHRRGRPDALIQPFPSRTWRVCATPGRRMPSRTARTPKQTSHLLSPRSTKDTPLAFPKPEPRRHPPYCQCIRCAPRRSTRRRRHHSLGAFESAICGIRASMFAPPKVQGQLRRLRVALELAELRYHRPLRATLGAFAKGSCARWYRRTPRMQRLPILGYSPYPAKP